LRELSLLRDATEVAPSDNATKPAFTTNIPKLKYDKKLINNKLYKTTLKNYFCV